jgi:hypothetical protein
MASPFEHLGKGDIRGSQAQLARAKTFTPPTPKTIELKTIDYSAKRNSIVIGGDSRGYVTAMPWITHEVGSNTVLGTVSSPVFLPSFYDDLFIRGGVLQSTNRALEDVYRISRTSLLSVKGALWTAREIGLQLTNPRPETRFFNPATLLLNVGTQHLGIRWPRHGGNPFRENTEGPPSAFSLSGYSTYATVGDYKIGGWDFSANDFVPVPRDMSKLDQMTLTSFQKPEGLQRLGNLLGANTHEYSAPPDQAGASAPFWPVSYLSRVHSAYGLNLLDRGMNRVYNTQIDFSGKQIHENVNENSALTKGAKDTSVSSNASISHADLTKYKTLAYGELGVEDKKYISGERDELIGPSENYKYSPKLNKRRPSKRSHAMMNRGFGDVGNPIDSGEDSINQYGMVVGVEEDFTVDEDLVPFIIYDIKTKTFLAFRATITGLNDAITPTWNEYTYIGNPLTFYTYKGATRQVGFSFHIFTNSAKELMPNWIKLNRLVGLCYPSYNTYNRMISPIIKLTLGDMYHRVPGFFNSLTVTIDDMTPWEINLFDDEELLKVPHVIQCDVNFTIIGDYLPKEDTYYFAQRKFGRPEWDDKMKNGLV